MKKLILSPKKDTITLCLPSDWVGKTVVCLLKEPFEAETEMVGQVSEEAILYRADRYRKISQRKPRNKRLRKRLL